MIRWRKHRTKSGGRTILVPDYLAYEDSYNQTASNYSKIATWVGALSQAAMVIILLFGYIYTVRPVFQHQLLQEKLATAELDRLEVEEQIQVLETERNRSEDNLREIKRQIELVEAQQRALEEELEGTRGRARQAQNRANRLEGVVQKQLNELETARRELLMIDFSFPLMFSDRNHFEEYLSFPEYLQRYRDEWLDPLSVLQSFIAALRKRNKKEPRYPDSYINDFVELVESRKDKITCETPPFDDLENLFQERSSRVDGVVDEKTKEYIDNLFSEHRERGERLIITEELRERVSRMYRVNEETNLNHELKEEVRAYLINCRLSAQSVVEEFKKIKGVTR